MSKIQEFKIPNARLTMELLSICPQPGDTKNTCNQLKPMPVDRVEEVAPAAPQVDGTEKPEITRKKALALNEERLAKHDQSGLEAARALKAINEGGLYKDEYETFEEYCQERWQIERAHAYRMVKAAEIYIALANHRNNDQTVPLPRTESQIRYLARLEQDKWEMGWTTAVAKAGNKLPSGAVVEEVVNEMKDNKKTAVPKQKTPFKKGVKKLKAKVDELCKLLKKGKQTKELELAGEIMALINKLGVPSDKPVAAKRPRKHKPKKAATKRGNK